MKVISVTPRGYCHGVVNAVEIAKKTASNPDTPRPIYILGQLVHNHYIVEELEKYGVISLENSSSRAELLADISKGTVIFTAHGVSPQVKEAAKAKGLNCVDTTCSDVEKTHLLIKELAAKDFDIIYIGKKGHPEPEGCIGEAPNHVFLIQDEKDLEFLVLPQTERLALTTQTTLSRWDTSALVEKVKQKYPNIKIHVDICLATQQRQDAAATQTGDAEVVFVVGDIHSSNTNRLAEVVRNQVHKTVYLIDSVNDIKPEMVSGKKTAAVTSGASTPTNITREVIKYLEGYSD
jgi:4-hydroxy-3-methylbut-2-enyl diphosphate reductase